MLRRIVSQVANPVRWDLCMETMADLGVTGILEMPPAGTLTGIAKRALKGVETFALKTPDQLDDARAFCDKHGERLDDRHLPTWRMVVSPVKGTFHRRRRRRRRRARARRHCRRRVSLRDEHRVIAPHGGTIVEWLVEDGDPVSPGQPLVRLHPEGDADDRPQHRDQGARRAAPRGRSSAIGSLPARAGWSPTPRSSTAIDSSDEWIQQRSGIIERRWAAAGRDRRRSMSVAAARKALDRRRHRRRADRLRRRRDRVATCCRPRPSPPRSPTSSAPTRRPPSTSPPPAPASATASRMASDFVRAGSAEHVLVIGVERLSDITDLDDRGTAFIFADGAGAVVIGPSDEPGHRPGGVGLRRRAVRPDPAARGLARRGRLATRPRCRT